MITQKTTNEVLQKAIEIGMSDVFPAMSIANALGGSRSDAWDVVRENSLSELVADALDRLMPVGDFTCKVTEKKFAECKSYLRVRGEIGGRSDFPV